MKIENRVLTEVKYNDIVNGEFIIPNSVIEIGHDAFDNCQNLTSIIIPNSIVKIDDYAFYNCIGLKSIIIPNSVTKIGGKAFTYCKNLESINIPNSVTEIRFETFSNCYNLKSITIPNLIAKIGYSAFENCKNFKSKLGNYKAFRKGLICMDMQYKPNEWNTVEGDIKLCEWGLHYVTNLFDIFNYYSGDLEKDIEIWEIEAGDIIVDSEYDSKKATNSVKPIKRLTREEIINILNNKLS